MQFIPKYINELVTIIICIHVSSITAASVTSYTSESNSMTQHKYWQHC